MKNDYYPFGMLMKDRKYSAGSGYRYGFNGKELDKDIINLTAYDYGFRIYSPALGRFLSVDPLQKKYPQLTPFQFASDSPIQGIDLDGREIFHYTMTMSSQGEAKLYLESTEELKGRGNRNIRRYIVDYWDPVANSCKTYHIGFPLYGVGLANGWRTEDFENDYIKKTGRYISFGFDYVDDDKSRATSDVSIILNSQNISAEHTVPFEGTATSQKGNSKKQNVSAHQGNIAALETEDVSLPGPTLKTSGGKTINNSKWANQLNPTALKKGFNVFVKPNGYPDFSNYLYTGGVTPIGVKTSKNTVNITMTGSYSGDFAAANKQAGFKNTPDGYTWHHTENMGTLQLVESSAHDAARHSGSVQTYRENHNGQGYR